MEKAIFTCIVKEEWVDYNGHLNDAEYARIFSLGVDAFMAAIGIDRDYIEKEQYSIFTLETHVCFLDEVNIRENVEVRLQLLDNDTKRLHVMFTMLNELGDKVATSEQMLMGMDMSLRKPAAFPSDVAKKIETIAQEQAKMDKPKETGRVIGVRRK